MSTEKEYISLEEMIKDHPEMEAYKNNHGYVVPDQSTDKMPDHSTCKGYPWTGVKTEDSFPYEKRFTKYEKVIIDPDKPTYVKIGTEKFMHKKIKELACKLIDTEHYLMEAEEQIKYMQEESPFVPEEFGFECVARPESITEAPIKIYCSKYNQNYSIYKIFGKRYDWKLLIKKDGVTFDELTLYFPCHRVAYAFFVAMGVKVEGEVIIYEIDGVGITKDGYMTIFGEKVSSAPYHGAPINLDGQKLSSGNAYIEIKEDGSINSNGKKIGNSHPTDALKAISPSKELIPEISLGKRLEIMKKDLEIGKKK